MSAGSSDSERARELNAKGAHAWRQGKIDKAERYYRDALIADVNFGPAHNNLGHLYLTKQQVYLAAWEFELAASTMPGRIEPIINLGLVYEHAHRHDQAETYYRQAFEMNPRSADAIAHLVRLLVRTEANKTEINFLLHELLLYDSRSSWRTWAEELLAIRYRVEDGSTMDATADFPSGTSDHMHMPQPDVQNLPAELLPSPQPSEPDPPHVLAPAINPPRSEASREPSPWLFDPDAPPIKPVRRVPVPTELAPSMPPSQLSP